MSFSDIIGVTEYHNRIILGETVHQHLGFVVLTGPVACGGIAIPAVEKSRLDGQVQHHVLPTIVITGMLLELRSLVIGFDVLHSLGRQLAHQVIATEKALAAHRQADGLAVPPEFAVDICFHTRQLPDEFVKTGTFLQPEGRWVEHDGVTVHGETAHMARDLDHLQHL